MEIRIGGIYALERIANDSDKDYWSIIETLTAYVRERAPWHESPDKRYKPSYGEKPLVADDAVDATTQSLPTTDIQAILNVLGRRKKRFGEGEHISLDLSPTNLQMTMLYRAHLEGAILVGSQLKKAHLREANLQKAHLTFANLDEAFLTRANLEEADLSVAFLNKTHLIDSNLEGANLTNAFLLGARLKGAKLKRTNLQGADLRYATGLTHEQLAEAIIDDKTILPDYLQEGPPRPRDRRGMARNKVRIFHRPEAGAINAKLATKKYFCRGTACCARRRLKPAATK